MPARPSIEATDTPIRVVASDPHVLDYLALIGRHRKSVFLITAGCGILFLAFTFLMPKKFQATVTILPPEKQSSAASLMSFLSGSSALDIMKSQENPAIDLFRNVIESRMLSEEVSHDPRIHRYIAQFDTSVRGMGRILRDVTTTEALRNGMMTLTVELPTHWMASGVEADSAKVLSAYLANLYISTLDHFNRERLMTTAHNTRVFIENAYNERMHSLDSLYTVFQQFQEEHKAIALPEQLTSTVQAAATLNAQVQQYEIQLGAEQQELNPNSNRVEMLKSQLAGAQEALRKFDDGTIGEYAVALRNVPELTRRFANFTREIKLSETLAAYIRQQLEQQRIEEQRDLPSLQVLDQAVVPERRSSPSRFAMLLLGAIVGFAISLVYVSVHTYMVRVRTNPAEHSKFLGFARSWKKGNRIVIGANGTIAAESVTPVGNGSRKA